MQLSWYILHVNSSTQQSVDERSSALDAKAFLNTVNMRKPPGVSQQALTVATEYVVTHARTRPMYLQEDVSNSSSRGVLMPTMRP
jgi:hypothetical protein